MKGNIHVNSGRLYTLCAFSNLTKHIIFLNSIVNLGIQSSSKMISDVQLAIFANILGVTVFLLVVLFHYVSANNPKNKE